MGVYIPNITIPPACALCRFGLSNYDGSFYCMVSHEEVDRWKRPNTCPLIEVKTPHGRLIDANDLNIRNSTEDEMRELFRTVIEAED